MTNEKHGPIIWKQYISTHDDFGNERKHPWVWDEGWGPQDKPGICSDYAGAIAANMDLWEEYTDYHCRSK